VQPSPAQSGTSLLAYKDGKSVRLVSRNNVDHSKRFPALVAAVASLPPRILVLDGEVAIFDKQLRSRFDWLREPDPDAVATPPILIAFDVLCLDGAALMTRPLRKRREELEKLSLIGHGELVLPARRPAPNGLEAWAQVLERGYEGYVAKHDASPYSGGKT
jgi:bifunctional non-homologous end joining protein LigD